MTQAEDAPDDPIPPYAVMVVDDSATMSALLTHELRALPFCRLVAHAANGAQAIAALSDSAMADKVMDVMLLDVDMPVMDGLAVIPHLLARDPHIAILMVSGLTRNHAETSLRALRAGALDYLAKPEKTPESLAAFKRDLALKVAALGALSRRRRQKTAYVAQRENFVTHPDKAYAIPHVIAIGASTGGPQALFKMMVALEEDVPQPIMITQHMPSGFTTILAEHIMRQSGRKTCEAADGMALENHHVYVAPGDRHMIVRRSAHGAVIALTHDAPVNYCRPSMDVMLGSLIAAYGGHVLAVMLTGMGVDGMKACIDLYNKGGAILAQDRQSSVIWGMPKAVAEAGICAGIVPIAGMAEAMRHLCRR